MPDAYQDSLPPPPANSDEPFSLPLPHPDPSAKPVPPKQLSPDEQDKLHRIVNHFNDPAFKLPNSLKVLKARWTKEGQGQGSRFGGLFGRSATPSQDEVRRTTPSPSHDHLGTGIPPPSFAPNLTSSPSGPQMNDLHPLNDVEKCYWSPQAFLRCFRAVKWDYAAALRRAEETAVWRREYGVEDMKEEDVWVEGETGKELVFGYDVNARPVLYMVRLAYLACSTCRSIGRCAHAAKTMSGGTDIPTSTAQHPWRQNTEVGPRQIAFVVWCLEVRSLASLSLPRTSK